MTEEEETPREPRTFRQDVEKMNVAHLVQIPTQMLERYSQLVEEAINAVGGRYVFSKSSSARLFIKEAYPRDRDDRRDDRPQERRRFNFGTDEQ